MTGSSRKIVVASNNAHKVAEISAALPPSFNLIPQSEFDIPSPPETGLTFVENALIKARHTAELTGLPCLADDSGLEVAALNGQPGIYSARYAGPNASDAENNEKLLTELADISVRTACFRCVIVLLRHAKDPMPVIAYGSWAGEILQQARGKNGFGYDPLFYLPEESMSVAEMSAESKVKLSHRGKALAQLASLLIHD